MFVKLKFAELTSQATQLAPVHRAGIIIKGTEN
jgi:hypothetical protein